MQVEEMAAAGLRRTFGRAGAIPRAAVFLDRDGVIIEDPGYLCRVEEIRYVSGAREAILALNRASIPVVMVTNQAGIGRGYYTWRDFEAVQSAIEKELSRIGAWLDGVWACAYHPEGMGLFQADNHYFRKPNPGMLEDAASKMGLDLPASWIVGDKSSDLLAGLRAGVRTAIHVRTGYGRKVWNEVTMLASSHNAGRVRMCSDLSEAVSVILGPSHVRSTAVSPGH